MADTIREIENVEDSPFWTDDSELTEDQHLLLLENYSHFIDSIPLSLQRVDLDSEAWWDISFIREVVNEVMDFSLISPESPMTENENVECYFAFVAFLPHFSAWLRERRLAWAIEATIAKDKLEEAREVKRNIQMRLRRRPDDRMLPYETSLGLREQLGTAEDMMESSTEDESEALGRVGRFERELLRVRKYMRWASTPDHMRSPRFTD